MWDDADVRDHVDEETDFKISTRIDHFIFSNEDDNVGNYKIIPSGFYQRVECPDVAAEQVFNEKHKLREYADELQFNEILNHQMLLISAKFLSTPIFAPLLLMVNDVFSNTTFTNKEHDTITIIPQHAITDFIANRKSKSYNKVEKISTPENLQKTKENLYGTLVNIPESIDDWLNHKIPGHNFKDIQDNPIFKTIKSSTGFTVEDIAKKVNKLKRYRKEHTSD